MNYFIIFLSILLINQSKSKSIFNETIDNSTCNGILESPWYCNDAKFFEDPRCKFFYNFKWMYDREKSELEVLSDYTRISNNEVVVLGLIHKGKDFYFDFDQNTTLFQDYLYFFGINESLVRYEIIDQGVVKITIKLTIDEIQCKKLSAMIFDSKDIARSLIYKIKSTTNICSNYCDVCYQELNVGDKCKSSEFRWYYNNDKQSCYRFIFNGCGGNDNNFKSFEECSKNCNDLAINQKTTTTTTTTTTLTPKTRMQTISGFDNSNNFDRILSMFKHDDKKKVNNIFGIRKLFKRIDRTYETGYGNLNSIIDENEIETGNLTAVDADDNQFKNQTIKMFKNNNNLSLETAFEADNETNLFETTTKIINPFSNETQINNDTTTVVVETFETTTVLPRDDNLVQTTFLDSHDVDTTFMVDEIASDTTLMVDEQSSDKATATSNFV